MPEELLTVQTKLSPISEILAVPETVPPTEVLLVHGGGVRKETITLTGIDGLNGLETHASPASTVRALAAAVLSESIIHTSSSIYRNTPAVVFLGSYTNPEVPTSEAAEMMRIARAFWYANAHKGSAQEMVRSYAEQWSYDTWTNIDCSDRLIRSYGLAELPVRVISSRNHLRRLTKFYQRRFPHPELLVPTIGAEEILFKYAIDVWVSVKYSDWYRKELRRKRGLAESEFLLNLWENHIDTSGRVLDRIARKRVQSSIGITAGHPVAMRDDN